MELFMAKPHITKLRLNQSSSSPGSRPLNQPVRNLLVTTSQLICLTDPCHPLKDTNLVGTNLPSAYNDLLVALPSAYKRFSFTQLRRTPNYLLDWMLPHSGPFLLK